ncbi:aldo/keto reductase [Candidatus Latescibacterota bacterium]
MKGKITRRDMIAGSVAGMGLTSLTKQGAASSKSPEMEGKMPMRPLGKTGEMVSLMAFGGGSRYAGLVKTEKEAEEMIHRAIELGVNYFDNAYAYGEDQKSQKLYGRFLCPTYRDQIFLTNKSIQRKADDYLREYDHSVINMKTDTFDLMYFHSVDTMEDLDIITGPGGALEAVRKLIDQKVVRFIGMSGHRNADVFIEAIDRIGLDVVMFPINAAHRYPGDAASAHDLMKRAMPHAIENDVAVMAMKTTAQDKLIGKGGVTAPELVRYAMSQPVSGTVVGMPGMKVLESCCKIARTFTPMTADERASMERKVASAVSDGSLYYLRPDYKDGDMA